ncbi:MAG: HAMP domain-containing histidine kinase [Treponema sp.]|nr:HAMP domain-containing histidine kinase [Treponema sp.]
MKHTFAARLSLRFMFILTTAVILLSFFILVFVRSLINFSQTQELVKAEEKIFFFLQDFQIQKENGDERFFVPELPYYLTYIAYDCDSQEIIATNDPFLPLLKETGQKAKHYFEKDFFFDGNLDILYFAKNHKIWNRNLTVAVAQNIEQNSFTIIFAKLPLALLFMAIPILLLSFLVSLFITKNTIKPVVRITKAAQSMSTQKLDELLPLTGRGDEIDELSKTFNNLFARIKADFDRERQFSSDVSHELNTPLTVISGQANLLLRWGKENPEQLEKSLNAIKDEAKSMHSIIENLLQISRLESGRIIPQILEFDVVDIFDRVKEEFLTVYPNVIFEICETRGAFLLKTDSEMLHQILTILVSNSVKFAGQNCTIKLWAEKSENGQLLIFESDNGKGFADSAIDHIFERFYRADEAHTRAAGGFGLGLSIAKSLCNALNAEISAENTNGNGALFKIKL